MTVKVGDRVPSATLRYKAPDGIKSVSTDELFKGKKVVLVALPVFLAGVRIAAVTVIGIATIGAVIDAGGLGELILQGIQRDQVERVTAGALAVTVLALAADYGLVRLELRARPWAARTAGAAA